MFKLFFNIVGTIAGHAVNFMRYHLYATGEEVTTSRKITHSLFSAALAGLSAIGGYTHKINKVVSIILTCIFAIDAEAQLAVKKEAK